MQHSYNTLQLVIYCVNHLTMKTHNCFILKIIFSARLLYYVTYVLRLSSWERIQVIVGAGGAAGVTEAVPRLVHRSWWSTAHTNSTRNSRIAGKNKT